MSQMGNSDKAGGIFYEVEVKGAAQAEAQLGQVGQAAQNLGNQAQEADKKTKAFSGGILGWTQRLKVATTGFREGVNAITQFAGRLTGLVALFGLVSGAIYGVVKGVGALWDGLVKMDARLKEAPANWQKVIDKHNEYLAVLEKINAVQGKVQPDTVAEGLVKNIDKERIAALEKETADRDKRIDELRKLIKEQNAKLTIDESLGLDEMKNTAAIKLTALAFSDELARLLRDRSELSGAGAKAQTAEKLIDEDKLAQAFAAAITNAMSDNNRANVILSDTIQGMNERLIGIESRLGGSR